MEIIEEIQSLEPTVECELFVLDTTMYEGGSIQRFHSGVSQLNKPIVWQGQTYDPIPLEASGFDISTQGSLPRPTLTVANVGGMLSALAISMEDLIGAKITRKKTLARYLDAVNFPKGNAEANPDQHFPDQLWYVNKKVVEDKDKIQWELSSAFDLDGIRIPLRQIVKNTCCWKYRSAECGYTGDYVDRYDQPTTDANQDACGKRLSSCKAHHGESIALPFGAFPGAERGD